MPGKKSPATAAAAVTAAPPPAAATNGGGKFIDSVNPDDPEYQRQLIRPAEIKEDLTLMEQRKRVSLILNSEAFRRELEEIVQSQLKSGGAQPAALMALRQLTDLLGPSAAAAAANAAAPVLPVNDLRGGEASVCSSEERLLRCKLASVYRLVDLHGWSEGIYNHVTARIEGADEHFLINPFGLEYSEITAGSLVKIDLKGDMIDRGCTVFGVNRAGWVLHSAIHSARPDIRAVIHLHTSEIVAVANSRCGLLPLCPEALAVGEVAAHDFRGIVSDESERDDIVASLGPRARVLLLRHHGACVCGATLEEAWRLLELLMTAVRVQLESLRSAGGLDNLWLPSDYAVAAARAALEREQKAAAAATDGWGFGQLEFEAAMRQLDAAGYRTGYVYREPRVRAPADRPKPLPQPQPQPVASPTTGGAADADDEGGAVPDKPEEAVEQEEPAEEEPETRAAVQHDDEEEEVAAGEDNNAPAAEATDAATSSANKQHESPPAQRQTAGDEDNGVAAVVSDKRASAADESEHNNSAETEA